MKEKTDRPLEATHMDGTMEQTTDRSSGKTMTPADHGHEPPKDNSSGNSTTPAVVGSAAFQAQYVGRDIAAGMICGVMAIPLSVGIAMMSDYPIKVALATVAFACVVGRINAFF